jgi:hypothetical protein
MTIEGQSNYVTYISATYTGTKRRWHGATAHAPLRNEGQRLSLGLVPTSKQSSDSDSDHTRYSSTWTDRQSRKMSLTATKKKKILVSDPLIAPHINGTDTSTRFTFCTAASDVQSGTSQLHPCKILCFYVMVSW